MDDHIVLTEEELMKLNKEEIVKFYFRSKDIAKSINELTETVVSLTNRLEKTEAELSVSKAVNVQLVERIDSLDKRIEANERSATNSAQYLRRRQLEINCTNTELKNGPELKNQVATMLSKTGTSVLPDDIDKCHTIGRRGAVIMELFAREQRDSVLRTRKSLKDKNDGVYGKIFISESLCDEYKKLDYAARKLKKNSKCHNSCFFNGRLWVQMDITSAGKQISHVKDMYNIFGKQAIDDIFLR